MSERNPVHRVRMIFLVTLMALLPGCATEYHDFAKTEVMTGAGGEKTPLHGIDLWTAGLPPRKFEVIGLITDNRPCGMLAMCARHSPWTSTGRSSSHGPMRKRMVAFSDIAEDIATWTVVTLVGNQLILLATLTGVVMSVAALLKFVGLAGVLVLCCLPARR